MELTLSVDGRPPARAHVGTYADRYSPNAQALAHAGLDALAQGRAGFPIRDSFSLTVVSGASMPDYEGYGVDDAIIEVLVDVGLIVDERLERRFRASFDGALGDSYTVTIRPDAN